MAKTPLTPKTPSIRLKPVSADSPELMQLVKAIDDLLGSNVDKDEEQHPGHGSMVLQAIMIVAAVRIAGNCPADSRGMAVESLQKTLGAATAAFAADADGQ